MVSEKDFVSGLQDARRHQLGRLFGFLRYSSMTAFGRDHDFAGISSLDTFRQRVPLRSYEDMKPYIDRVISGEHNVLFGGAPYCYLSSSGSTSGRAKVLPMSRDYFADIYTPFLHLYMSALKRHCPDIARDWDATINFKWDPLYGPATLANGEQHLGMSQVDLARGFNAEGMSEPGTASPWSYVPAHIDCLLDRLYYRVRFAAGADIRQIVGINPAIIAALPDLINDRSERLINDLATGSYDGAEVGGPEMMLARRLSHAREQHGRLLPRHLWPNLQRLLCWDQGAAGVYLPAIVPLYGDDCEVVPAPLGASESPLAISLPTHGIRHVLTYRSSFYEFIDVQDDRETPLLLDELKPGAHYRVVVSNHSGLYRYVLGDIVKVSGYIGQAPTLAYCGRYNADDALPESCLIDAVAIAVRDTGLSIRNFTFRHHQGTLQLQVEPAASSRHALSGGGQTRLLQAVNAGLGRAVIDSIQVEDSGAFSASWMNRVRSGLRPPQVKDRVWNGL